MIQNFQNFFYDMKSDEGSDWVRQGDESESGEIVLKQVKLTFFDAYLWQAMWNHACMHEFSGRIRTELLPSSDFLS